MVPVIGTVVLVLVGLAAFLIVALGGGSSDVSSLPAIEIGGAVTATGPASSATSGNSPAGSSTTTFGATTVGSTLRETISGPVHTSTTGGTSGTGPGPATGSTGDSGS